MNARHLAMLVVLGLPACGAGVAPSSTSDGPAPSGPADTASPPAGTVAPPPTAKTPPTVLVDGTGPITSLAVDDIAVYWTTGSDDATGDVVRLRRDATSPDVLATGQAAPKDLRVSLGMLTWANTRRGSAAVMRMSATGGVPVVVAAAGSPVGPSVNEDLYFVDEDSGELLRVPISGGETKTVTTIGAATALAIDARHAYFLADALYSVRLDGDSFAGRLSQPCFYPVALAVGYEEVFFACQDGTVRSSTKDGSVRRTLFSRDVRAGSFAGIATDDRHVYVTSTSDAALVRISALDGSSEVLARGDGPGPVVLDREFVYVAMGARLLRLPK